MEVMDLSIRKPHHPPIYTAPGPYMMPNLPMYTYPPPNLVPTTMQPSISHLGLFQQLQYAATPQLAPPFVHMPVECPLSPQRAISMHSPSSSHEVSSENEGEGSYKISSQPPVKRPFKTLASAKTSSLNLALDPAFEAEYEEYRKKVLSQVTQEDSRGTNRNMRRNVPTNPEKSRDPEYMEKRKKNNEAAKKSRDARKAKEDELAIRVAFLEKENLKMKFQLAAIEREKKMILMRTGQMKKIMA